MCVILLCFLLQPSSSALDEIVCSTVHRCLEPVMMEPSVCNLTVFSVTA